MASIEVGFLNRFESFFNNIGDVFDFNHSSKSPQVKERGGNNFSLGDLSEAANSSAGRTATGWASQLLGGRKKSSGGISEACQNTPTAIYEKCGCNPLHEAVGNFLAVIPLDETMKTTVKRISYNYGSKSYPQALELADCTIRIQVLATGQKILEIAPK